jgi:hypothetical protein
MTSLWLRSLLISSLFHSLFTPPPPTLTPFSVTTNSFFPFWLVSRIKSRKRTKAKRKDIPLDAWSWYQKRWRFSYKHLTFFTTPTFKKRWYLNWRRIYAAVALYEHYPHAGWAEHFLICLSKSSFPIPHLLEMSSSVFVFLSLSLSLSLPTPWMI